MVDDVLVSRPEAYSLAGAGALGLVIPPSIIVIVYGVAAEVPDEGLGEIEPEALERRFHFRDPAGNELAVWSET